MKGAVCIIETNMKNELPNPLVKSIRGGEQISLPAPMKRYPPVIMGTCVVPWTSQYHLNEPIFREEIRALARDLTRHLYVFGTAGEGYAVNESQFEKIARVFQEETSEAKAEGLLGIISLSLPTIIERIEKGRGWGFRAFQISLPSWGALTDREVETFFEETCGRFTDCHFMHYNLNRSKRLLTGDEYGRLAEKHPNLVASKNSSSDETFLVNLLEKAPQLQHFLTEAGYSRMRDRYECGLLISLAGIHPGRAKVFFNARANEMSSMAAELQGVLKALLEAVGGQAHMDGAYDKILYKMHCGSFPLRLLPPYASVDDATFERFIESLRKELPAWLPEG
jgi:dihydrodipicolinate synthase/N-acetylneuraminate lyase